MDEGDAVAYTVLEEGVPVVAGDGEQIGRVAHVVVASRQDIFHGLVIDTHAGPRFVPAADIAAVHERAVNLTLDSEQAAALEPPSGVAAEFAADVGLRRGVWGELLDRLTGHRGWRRG
jgi:uncharacterized protein YrrD